MAKMMTRSNPRERQICCDHCVTHNGRYMHGGRLDPRYRKTARAADKRTWKKDIR